jgi:methylenetetrahydrofolate reductase (NADPH)
MTKFCKTRVPESLRAKMDSIQDDAEAVKAFGIEYGIHMCQELMEIGVDVLHFYTLNLEKVTFGILQGLGYEVKGVADESDATTMVAKGSAWARVGDKVKTGDSTGVVQEIHSDGSATVLLDGSSDTVHVTKDQYSKVFN